MSQKTKILYSVRLDPELLDRVKEQADQENETVTAIFEQALNSFLSAPNDKTNVSIDQGAINQLRARIERLEAEFHQLKESDKHKDISFNKPDVQDKPNRPDPINPEDAGELGDLITKKEAAALTGYSVNTLNRTFSQNDVLEVDKRGKAGLYRKSEILDKIGKKGGE